MYRIVFNNLQVWKDKADRKPLIFRGARQVGKTYAITQFGKECFDNLVVIDFEKKGSVRKLFDADFDISAILALLEVESGQKIIPGKTLLFFDEIQLCPRALMALRYFFEEKPELHVVAAGSLLEFEMEKISFPVGRVEFEWMYPLSFAEFLLNTGQESLLEKRPKLNASEKISEYLHEKFLEQAKLYSIVGGMPEAVYRYIQNKSFHDVAQVHRTLHEALMQDILKYEKNVNVDNLQEMLGKIPRVVGHQIKYTGLAPTSTIYATQKTLHILEKTLLIHRIDASSAVGLPLALGVNKKIFKYLFLDIGLMQYMCGIPPTEVMQAKNLLDIYEGMLCEQFVGQELLVAGGSQHNKLYYWQRAEKSSNAEVDYLFTREGEIFPLEVKSGPSGRLRSLHLFLKEHPTIKKGFVFHAGLGGDQDKISFRPFYSSFALRNDPFPSNSYS